MTEKSTPDEFEKFAHQQAWKLLFKTLESQPQLLSGSPANTHGGKGTGEFLNSLYDQCLELSRKNLKGEGV